MYCVVSNVSVSFLNYYHYFLFFIENGRERERENTPILYRDS